MMAKHTFFGRMMAIAVANLSAYGFNNLAMMAL